MLFIVVFFPDENLLVLLGLYHLLSKLFIYIHIIFLGRQGSIEKTSNKCFFWTVEWARSITELWFTDFAWLWSSSWTFLWNTGPNLKNLYVINIYLWNDFLNTFWICCLDPLLRFWKHISRSTRGNFFFFLQKCILKLNKLDYIVREKVFIIEQYFV